MTSCSRENQFANGFISPHCSSTFRWSGADDCDDVITASRREITRLDASLILLLLDGANLGEEGQTPRVFRFPTLHYLARDRAGNGNKDGVKENGLNMKT